MSPRAASATAPNDALAARQGAASMHVRADPQSRGAPRAGQRHALPREHGRELKRRRQRFHYAVSKTDNDEKSPQCLQMPGRSFGKPSRVVPGWRAASWCRPRLLFDLLARAIADHHHRDSEPVLRKRRRAAAGDGADPEPRRRSGRAGHRGDAHRQLERQPVDRGDGHRFLPC